MIKQHKPILCLFLAFSLWSCGSGDEAPVTDNSADRQKILTHWVDNIIKPSYANFKTKFDAMAGKADAFAATPGNAALAELRDAWVAAYIEWQKTELFEVGPADRYSTRNFFNIYPADAAGIEANIANPSANLDVPAAYAQQGFPTLDYLLNGVGAQDDDIVAYYTAENDGAKRLAYLDKLIARMDTRLSSIITEWSGSYRDTFISKTGLDVGSSTGLMVNAYVLHYERYIRSGKIGIPSGALVAGGGSLQPGKVEAFYKKNISLTLAKTAQQAARDFFNGKNVTTGEDGPSLKSYLDALEAKDATSGMLLSKLIDDQFEATDTELNKLSENLYEEVQTDNSAMLNVFDAMQATVRMLKVDMTSAMSITITYTDNDGD